jgi:hypothetical protein
MSGSKHRSKGNRVEREIVQLHKDMGIHAERYPLSGSSHFRGASHDIDIYPFGRDCPLVAEVKARKSGNGFAQIKKWLGENDVLFTRENQEPQPTVHMPWRTYVELMENYNGKTQRAATDGIGPGVTKSGEGTASEKITIRWTDAEADKTATARQPS